MFIILITVMNSWVYRDVKTYQIAGYGQFSVTHVQLMVTPEEQQEPVVRERGRRHFPTLDTEKTGTRACPIHSR